MPAAESVIAAMAEIGAMRNLRVQALALRLVDEASPQNAVDMLGRLAVALPTQPPEGRVTGLDPAVSDYLAPDRRTHRRTGG